jgi:hypothetical protein
MSPLGSGFERSPIRQIAVTATQLSAGREPEVLEETRHSRNLGIGYIYPDTVAPAPLVRQFTLTARWRARPDIADQLALIIELPNFIDFTGVPPAIEMEIQHMTVSCHPPKFDLRRKFISGKQRSHALWSYLIY